MILGAGDGIETALIDLDFMTLHVGRLQRIGHRRSGDADLHAGILLAPADPPFQQKDEIAKCLLDVPVEPAPTSLGTASMMKDARC